MTRITTRVRASAGVGTLVLVMAFAGPAMGQGVLGRVVDVSAPHFYVALLQIPAYTQLVLETAGCVAPADPVFHLLTIGGATQVAYDDDGGGGLNSRIVLAPTSTPTQYMLLMRSYNHSSFGTCDVLLNGSVLDSAMPVGGWRVPASQVTFGANDRLHTQHVPGGSTMPALVKFSPSMSTVTGAALGNFIGGSSRLTLAGNEAHFMVGTPVVRVHGGSLTVPRGGGGGLLSNDHLNDTDGDGVGNELELALLTCPADPCGFNAFISKDSDRDGLEDGEEVFGLPASSAAAEVPLARWGASPLRKDIFLQMSYLTRLDVPDGVLAVPTGVNPFAWLRANPSLANGFYKHTVEDWVANVREPFTPATANNHLKNRDGSWGVALHIDLGVPPQNVADEEHFGDYSMAASRAIVGDFVVTVNGPIAGWVWVQINGEWKYFNATGKTPAQIATLIGEAAEDTGEPVFVQSVHSGTATVTIRSSIPGQHFTREVWPGSGVTVDREPTGSLFTRYHEDQHLDPARRGRFRMTIATALDDGGQAELRFPANVIGVGHDNAGDDLTQVAHELGHSLGLRHWGHDAWGTAEAECMPHYRSLMSYADTEYRFADTDNIPALNPAHATEGAPFGGSFPYAIFQGDPWSYFQFSPPWDVVADVNRNNGFDYGSFRAPVLSAFWESCKAFVQGASALVSASNVGGPVDLVRAGGRLYALWTQGTTIRYRRATLGAVGNKSCTGSADPTQGTSCLSWSSTTTLASGSAFEGVTAYEFGGQLFVAANTSTGSIVVRRYNVNLNGTLALVSPTWTFAGSASEQSAHGPELTEVFVGGQPVLALLYLAQSGEYRQRFWSGSAWGAHSAMLNQSGVAILGTEGPAAIAWPDADRGWPVSERKTFVVVTDAAKRIAIHQRLSSGRWHLRYAPASPGPIASYGKPFMTFRAIRRSDGSTYDTAYHEYPGHFLIGSVTDVGTAAVRFSAVYDRFDPPGYGFSVLRVGDHIFNIWAHGQGTASSVLYSDSTIDNVFGVLVLNDGLRFLPHADGSPDRELTVHSDFRALEDMVCETLQSAHWSGVGCGAIDVTD